MLDSPITQRDVDEGTVFVRRDGSQTRISISGSTRFPWEQPDGGFSYMDNGNVWDIESPADLISRLLPKGEKMESQVTGEADSLSKLEYYDGTGCMEALESMGIAKEVYRGLVVKYMWRLGRKGDALKDAIKAKNYCERLIGILQAETNA